VKHLYVVAHTQATHHVEGRVGGWHDSSLTDLGRRQASLVARRLRDLVPEDAPVEIHASDLKRAFQTAEAIARLVPVPIRATADLREISYGAAEGKSQAWLDERFAPAPRGGNRLDHDIGIPGAETRRRFAQRIYRGMDRILASPCPHQIVVTHGFAVTFVVAAWIEMPLAAARSIAVHSTPGGVTLLVEDDRFRNRAIVSVNDTAHLV
jgi:2,3-bisphosphoglycerate-dependent phosphoglycerate mutase